MKFKILIVFAWLIILINQQLAAQCTDNTHSNNSNDSWLSCQTSTSPNPIRGNSHWLLYDLGYAYELEATQIWNYNVSNATNLGANNIIIDYSMDGNTWSTLGTFPLNQASGNNNYSGFNGPNFNGVIAQYVLITFQSNFAGTNCIGISEVQISVAPNNTNCGDFQVTSNIANNPIANGIYFSNTIITSNGKVTSGYDVTLKAGQCITLNTGFEVKANGEFSAIIENCSNTSSINNEVD